MPTQNLEKLRDLTLKIDSLEKANAEMAKLFRLMMTRVPKAMVIAMPDRFIHVSDHFANLLGRTTADLTSRPWMDFVHPDDVPPTTTVRDGIMEDGDTPVMGFRNRYRHFDGHYVTLEWTASSWDDGRMTFGWVEEVCDAD